jgi:ADP-ribosylglycohydrolase
MVGAIIGDIVGSPYEGSRLNWVDDRNFPLFAKQWSRFTDDTVLTCATADALLHPVNRECRFDIRYKEWALKYPGRGYGSGFQEWVNCSDITVNNSYANGAMMRCSPIALFYPNIRMVELMANDSIKMTHCSPESRRGVLSITSAIHMALNGNTKLQIQAYVEEQYGHMLDLTVEQWRQHPKPNIRCNLSAPQALTCFMESTDYESAIRNAVYTKGDTDTIAAIAGSIAEAFYGVKSIPPTMIVGMKERITPEMVELINEFYGVIGNDLDAYKGFQI